jgi:mannosyltransferase OCH1-like enzyme
MTIPKLIHVCWFGGGRMSRQIQRCMRAIYALESQGYRVMFWDESNYDVQASPRVHAAYSAKRWSLVSNYVRLDVLNRHGGVYLDTDIEVVRPFDDLLDYDFFLGFMWDCTLGTAVLGSVPGHPILQDILRSYDEIPTAFKSPNNDTFTEYFLNMVPGFQLNGREQSIANVFVADKFVFEQPSLFKRENYTIHHFEQSWKPNSSAKVYVKAAVVRLFSLWLYRKYVCWRSLRISPYYGIFRRVRAEERSRQQLPLVSRLKPRTVRDALFPSRATPANDVTAAVRTAHG